MTGIPKKIQRQIKNDVGEYLKEQVLLAVGEAKSPVQGESMKPLSKDYRAHKIAEGGVGKANMEKGGDMLNALDFKVTPEGIELGFFGDQADKADGHLKFSGRENPFLKTKRRFLPGEGQSFKPAIEKEVERIIGEATADLVSPSDFKKVKSKAEFYEVFKEILPNATRAEVRQFILGNANVMTMLDRIGMLGFL